MPQVQKNLSIWLSQPLLRSAGECWQQRKVAHQGKPCPQSHHPRKDPLSHASAATLQDYTFSNRHALTVVLFLSSYRKKILMQLQKTSNTSVFICRFPKLRKNLTAHDNFYCHKLMKDQEKDDDLVLAVTWNLLSSISTEALEVTLVNSYLAVCMWHVWVSEG